ncbi:MAG: RsmE family RNA methyltransferase [Bacteroidota bacterium]
MFYAPELNPESQEFVLNEEESKHCVRVLRKEVGDIIELLDGKGGGYVAEITAANPKKCSLSIIRYVFYPPTTTVHLAVAPTKNMDRMEWLVEKATELGCTHVSFLQTKRTERSSINMERLTKIAVAAMKQSKRTYLPQLDAPIPFVEFVQTFPGGWMAHCLDHEKRQELNGSVERRILIGPEGDFTQEEIADALSNGYKAISLGEARLRTETAALKSVMMLELLGE